MISLSSTMIVRTFDLSFFSSSISCESIRVQRHVDVEIGDTIFLYTRRWMHIKIPRRNIWNNAIRSAIFIQLNEYL